MVLQNNVPVPVVRPDWKGVLIPLCHLETLNTVIDAVRSARYPNDLMIHSDQLVERSRCHLCRSSTRIRSQPRCGVVRQSCCSRYGCDGKCTIVSGSSYA